MKQKAPDVAWQPASKTPEVHKGELQLFWIAVKTDQGVAVYLANYINKPLELDENDDPVDDDHFVDTDGQPMAAVGWHNEYDHPDFSGYYEKMQFNEHRELLGWAEYVPPVWTGEAAA